LSRTVVFAVAAAICAAAGAAAALAHKQTQSACTATDAAGLRVVIGTELTEDGRRYRRDNPADDNNAILEALAGRGPEAAWTRESIARCRLRIDLSGGARIPLFVLAAAFAVAAAIPRRRAPARRRKSPAVFLSYNHADASEAAKLRQFLATQGVAVLIDSEAMTAGERIQDFIARSIRESDVVVSLVSNRSLLSAWVALETIQTLQRNRWLEGRKWIACYLDDAFFAPESRLDYTRQIDERLDRVEKLIAEYSAKRLDTVDLNEEKTRLYDLRNNLGLILATFKESLCLDVRDPAFAESGRRLLAAIRETR
jgi:hypothetical protein